MRPYKVTQQQYDTLMEKFSNYLKSINMTTSELNFKETVQDTTDINKVSVTFTPKAYIKMRDLVDRYASEIGWFGFIDKLSDLEYQITDICVYSQLVTGGTVKEDNGDWDKDMTMDQIRRRHFHGHSHVNMPVSPSGTDIKHRDDQVYMCKSDSFFLFMITNKSCAWSAQLFDLAGNMVYNTEDILIDVDFGDGTMLSDFVEDTKKLIRTQTASALTSMMNERKGKSAETPAIQTTSNGLSGQSAWLPKPHNAKAEQKSEKQKKKIKANQSFNQPSMFDSMTDEELENFAYTHGDYFDDFLGYVSDTPPMSLMR